VKSDDRQSESLSRQQKLAIAKKGLQVLSNESAFKDLLAGT
jgi:hypothetical protein